MCSESSGAKLPERFISHRNRGIGNSQEAGLYQKLVNWSIVVVYGALNVHRVELSGPEPSAVSGASHGRILPQVEPGHEAAPPGDRERALCWEAPSSG